jgi:hypothetical protein
LTIEDVTLEKAAMEEVSLAMFEAAMRRGSRPLRTRPWRR